MKETDAMRTREWRIDAPARLGAVVTDDDDRIIVAENLSHEDARKIAAAPEAVQSCYWLLRFAERNPHLVSMDFERAVKWARVAIAKSQPA